MKEGNPNPTLALANDKCTIKDTYYVKKDKKDKMVK